MKNRFGHAAYFTGALPIILKLRTTYLKVTDDQGNVYEGDYIYGSALNSTSLAGTFDIPKKYVDVSDGVSEREAEAIAINHAGLTNKDVSFLHSRLVDEGEPDYYHVEFRGNNVPYKFWISVVDGEILLYEKGA